MANTSRAVFLLLLTWGTLALNRAACGSEAVAVPTTQNSAVRKTRSFDFTYRATIQGLQAADLARIWIPEPSSDEDQEVEVLTQNLPGKAESGQDAVYQNHILYFGLHPDAGGSIALSITYRVTRRESGEERSSASDAGQKYLQSDRLVPIGGKPLSLLRGLALPSDQFQLARLLYDVVDNHMQYRKDKPGWGQGDAVWACESGFGNCTDFHSLFISLARSEHLPAKFEIGFAIPQERGSGPIAGYHCWAKCMPSGHGWVPLDIAEANQNPAKRKYYFGHLTENRVAFSTGRDLVLVPKQSGEPVNFLIYPYVEIRGQALPRSQIKMQCSYRDVSAIPKPSEAK